jgi:signal transduction histidine kinase/CheY-like chemotaxis protein
MPLTNQLRSRFPIQHTVFGCLFGLCFPIVSTFIESYTTYGAVSLENAFQAQQNSVLLWVIDSAPFFLGLAFFIAGKYQQNALANLEQQQLAQSASQAKSEFLAKMSHEIRTPITTVIGSIQLLEKTQATPQQIEHYFAIKTAADSLLNIINNILDISKIEANKLEFEQVAFSLESVLQESLQIISPQAHTKKLEVLCDIDPAIPDQLIGDPVRLRQVLINLLSNSVKFTERGSVHLLVDHPSFNRNKIQLRFRIQDTGIGIIKDQQDRIFQAFSQADESITRRFSGTGLGLAICKQFVEAMEGSISVQSRLNEGSTFTITPCFSLPTTTESNREDGRWSYPSTPGTAVLVIDPSQQSRRILFKFLSQGHLLPKLAETCALGMVIIKNSQQSDHPIRLVLLDALIEHSTIAHFLRQIDKLGTSRPAIIMMQTGVSSLSDTHLQADAQIHKPILPSRLTTQIETILTHSHQPAPSYSKKKKSDPPNLSGKRILVVEDNEVNRVIIIKLLSETGCTCAGVGDGLQAIEKSQLEKFDLIFMDLHMPHMGGIVATKLIRADEKEGVHTHIVALTADATTGVKDECFSAGMDGFLTKPVRLNELFELLSELFSSQTVHPRVHLGGQTATPD